MNKTSVIDLFTTLRAVALAVALVGLAFLLAGIAFGALGGRISPFQAVALFGAFGVMGFIGGLMAAAVLSVARWLVARSTFHSPQSTQPPQA